MKNKIITLLFVILAGVELMNAERTKIGDLYYNDTVRISIIPPYTFRYDTIVFVVSSPEDDKYSGDIIIPATVEWKGHTHDVSDIADNAFSGCTGITSVTIGDNVKGIGFHAFSGCTGLTSIIIPENVITIGDHAFSQCTGLPIINNIRYADTYLIEAVDVSLSTYTIQEGTKWIGGFAFKNCTNLTSITIPNSVKDIGASAFCDCLNLTSITIPDDVISIGDMAFNHCPKLVSVSIGNHVTSIGNLAFADCFGLTSITIPNSVINLGFSIFENCTNLVSVSIGNQITTIEAGTFYLCSSLTSVTIPDNVTSIGDNAFGRCTSLTSITIPNSVTYIETSAFRGCSSLNSIIVENGNPVYDSRENCNAIIETASNTLMITCRNTIIPNSVTCIGNNAYHSCSYLTSFIIPNFITSIGNSAFSDCSNMTSIIIPTNVTTIGYGAFSGCSSLSSVTCESEIPIPINSDYCFNGIPDDATLYVPVDGLEVYKESAWQSWFNNIVGMCTVTFIDTEGNIQDVQTVMYDSAAIAPAITTDHFGYTASWDADLSHITSNLTVHVQFTRDAINGLYYLYNLEQQTAILDREGDSYKNLNAVSVPNIITYRNTEFSVTSIADSAFAGCDRLKEVTVANSVEQINNNAFDNCTDLERLTLGAGLRGISDYAFNGCKRLEEITVYAERVPDLTEYSFSNVGRKEYIIAYVPETRLNAYQKDELWSEFDLRIKSADVVDEPIDDVIVDPDDNEVTLTWPTDNNADSYTIVITKNGEVICTLIFNANGQLIGIAFAPGRDGHSHAPAARMANGGMQFTVTGLDIATRYNFTITTKDAMSNILAEYTGSFGTTGAAESIVQISNGQQATSKLLRDGQILILRGNKTYTVTGQEVK